MAMFTLATLKTPDGPKAAIGVADKYYLLSVLQPLLAEATCKAILQSRHTSLPLLEGLAEKLSDGKQNHPAGVAGKTATLLAPVLYPDGLFAVGANYSGHLKEMGLDSKKRASMPWVRVTQ